MDRAFLSYYEEELGHIRALATEFAAMHPTVARNLSLETVPCPDPYVERLLEGVAFLAARTRLKLDIESGRHVRNLLDALYPDLVAPAPAMGMATLVPGPQVEGMPSGHTVPRGTRFVAGLREGLDTRAIYTTAQDVTLWPIEIAAAEYLQDAGALHAAGLSDRQIGEGEAGILVTLSDRAPAAWANSSSTPWTCTSAAAAVFSSTPSTARRRAHSPAQAVPGRRSARPMRPPSSASATARRCCHGCGPPSRATGCCANTS